MASSSVDGSNGMTELRFRNRNCFCNQRASLGISESDKNPGKLYAKCARNWCKFFDWVYPENAEALRGNAAGVMEREELELVDRMTKLEIEPLHINIDKLKGRVDRLEEIVSGMKMIFKE